MQFQINENRSLVPDFSFVLPFERSVDLKTVQSWWDANWTQSIYLSVGYLSAVLIGQKWMASREPFKLRKPLLFWNVFLAIFSILATRRAVPEMIHALGNFGWHYSVCNSTAINHSEILAFWSFGFTMSKVFELVDTAFIVLRKGKLTFLHLFHHSSALIYVFYCFSLNFAPARWFLTMNTFVHSFMYTYFAFCSVGIRLPRPIAMSITLLQISQMILGLIVCLYAAVNIHNCPNAQWSPVYFGLAIYVSFSYLFIQFFIRSYFSRNGAAKGSKATNALPDRKDRNGKKMDQNKEK